MNQIPQDKSYYCRECPCQMPNSGFCSLFQQPLKQIYDGRRIDFGKVQKCLSLKPRIMIGTDLGVIRKVLNNHRREAYLSCPPSCWCWEVSEALGSIEVKAL